MSRFIQLHLLTSYPPSNLNRDDLGRPKTAVMGGKTRLRISSQSLKRAWRTSDIFSEALVGHVGTRTKLMGVKVYQSLREKGVAEKKAKKWAGQIGAVFGKLKKEEKKGKEAKEMEETKETQAKSLQSLEIEQLAHFSHEEEAAIEDLVNQLATSETEPTKEDLRLLRKKHTAADIAMFGRMLASAPVFNTEAAVQVAHAVTVHEVAVEDDYFTAVDDLNKGEDDLGAAHIGETEFAAGVYYLYLCINRELLKDNLKGDDELAKKAIAALVEAAAKIAPNGKQNSFASRAYASYLLAEKGSQQPRSLSVAYLKPVRGEDVMGKAISELEDKRTKMDEVYGPCTDAFKVMNAESGEGSLQEIISFVTE